VGKNDLKEAYEKFSANNHMSECHIDLKGLMMQ
jgi:hypothetical protein